MTFVAKFPISVRTSARIPLMPISASAMWASSWIQTM